MDSLAFINMVSNPGVTSPGPAKTHTRAPSAEDLDAIELPDHGLTQQPATPSSKTPAKTPNELERSQPPTPQHDEITPLAPSWSYPSMNKYRILAACLEYFGNGMNDSAPGALIPYIEAWYGIGYAVVSLFWITNAAGFILSAFCNDAISTRLGRARSLMLSEALMVAGYVVLACPVPYPVFVLAYLVLGFGNALNLALNNVFCGNLNKSTVVLGAVHGSYGLGGIAGPLVATAMVTGGLRWNRFYLVTLGVRVLCFFATGWSFWDYEKEGSSMFANSLDRLASQQAVEEAEGSKLGMLGRALRNRTTLIGALFIFAYQGAEVSESGWFITWLINARDGDPAKVGYVTSGFWAGITLGRFTLSHLAQRVGEKKSVLGLSVGAIVFQVLAWQIPNIIANSVAVSILGLLLGPIYPCAQTIFTRLLPGKFQVFSIGFISSGGSSGGAVVPFLTGLVAEAAGPFVLHPICIGFFVVMLVCWATLPTSRKRSE